jgi:hypothetical protein
MVSDLSASVARIDEAPFVRRLLTNSLTREDVLRIKGIPSEPVVALQNVPYPHGKGDIDILVCAEGHPQEAAAIQVKVIKFAKDAAIDGKQPPNGLEFLTKGVQQANTTMAFGFARAYLYVFVAVDARRRNAGKGVTYEGLPAERHYDLDNSIRECAHKSGLDPQVILVRFDFAQTMDGGPLISSSGTHLIAPRPIPDAPNIQRPGLTQWVARTIASRTAIS